MADVQNYENTLGNEASNNTTKTISGDKVIVRKIKELIVNTTTFDINTKENCYQIFEVVNAANKSLIGKKVVCKIVETRKSNISGLEGILTIRPLYIDNETNGQIQLLPTDIYLRGKNRANVKFWTSFLIIPTFIPGTGAKLPDDKEFEFYIK